MERLEWMILGFWAHSLHTSFKPKIQPRGVVELGMDRSIE